MILSVDPGPEKSAYVIWDGKKILDKNIIPNEFLLKKIYSSKERYFIIEMVASYGMPVGKDIFETVYWIGRFCEAWEKAFRKRHIRIYRKDIKLYFCNSIRAKDSNIRQVLIDRFGKKGTKKNPGVTYGLSGDLWQAFALAVFCFDKKIKIEGGQLDD